jgi:redox-sensitive bicupin YhaK (pirin superfamily)
MPAVHADTLTLPRLPEPAAGAVERPVASVTAAPSGFEGEGFPVRRAFAGVALEALDPFVHMDQMGAVDYGPGEPRGTDWHPHRGFETVTYILDGTFQHQDSNGGGGLITDGATQWMTAGGGILHIETPPEELVVSGGLFHGLQLWVNLPSADKMTAPRYQSLEGEQATLLASADGGALVRIIAGDVAGHTGPGATHTPITFLHATVAPGARLHLPWRADFNALAYVLSGSGRAGSEGRPVGEGDLVVFGPGDHLLLRADSGASPASPGRTATPNLEVVVLGGRPIREPVAWYGPFVMNTRAEVMQAVEDYQAGRLGVVPAGALMPHGHGQAREPRVN